MRSPCEISDDPRRQTCRIQSVRTSLSPKNTPMDVHTPPGVYVVDGRFSKRTAPARRRGNKWRFGPANPCGNVFSNEIPLLGTRFVC